MYRRPAVDSHGADALSVGSCQTTAHCSVLGIRKGPSATQPPAGKPRTGEVAPPSRAKIPTPAVAPLVVTSNRTPVFVGAGPVSVGAGSGGGGGGEEIATNVLAATGPGGLLAGASGFGLTVGTTGEDTRALDGAADGLPA